jgi:hypothetical protein
MEYGLMRKTICITDIIAEIICSGENFGIEKDPTSDCLQGWIRVRTYPLRQVVSLGHVPRRRSTCGRDLLLSPFQGVDRRSCTSRCHW